jgi:hypothetical protein
VDGKGKGNRRPSKGTKPEFRAEEVTMKIFRPIKEGVIFLGQGRNSLKF